MLKSDGARFSQKNPIFPFWGKRGSNSDSYKKKQQMALRRTFLRIGFKDFFDIVHEVRGLYMLKSDGARFSQKNPISPFWAKRGQILILIKKVLFFFISLIFDNL